MATHQGFSNETIIYVSTESKLNFEETKNITDELLRIIGYSNADQGFKFRFVAADDLTQAHASVDRDLHVSITN